MCGVINSKRSTEAGHCSLSPEKLELAGNSNTPSRNSSSPVSTPGCVVVPALYSVNAAFGNCFQMARSSAVIVTQPNLNMYRPGSVTCPTCAQVNLLTSN